LARLLGTEKDVNQDSEKAMAKRLIYVRAMREEQSLKRGRGSWEYTILIQLESVRFISFWFFLVLVAFCVQLYSKIWELDE